MQDVTRKNMRLKNYDYSANGAYFITVCTKNRQNLFGKITVGDDAHIVPKIQLSPIGEVLDKHIQRIVGLNKYVIMPNHFHIIIFIGNPDDTGTMQGSVPYK